MDKTAVKVFKMNDYSWFASKCDKEKTNEYYKQEIDDNEIEDLKECNLDTEGMWYETMDENDIAQLGNADTLKKSIGEVNFGDLWRKGGEVYKFVSFREVLAEMDDFEEPFEIATTEW